MSEDLAPDYSTPIIGWRVWWIKLHPETRAPYLSSITAVRSQLHGGYWPKREALVAQCSRYVGTAPDAPCTESPTWGCSCGIYAYSELNDHITTVSARISRRGRRYRGPDPGTQVMGQVGLWGRVVRHAYGYRAEKAYPLTLGLKAPLHPSIKRETLFEDLLDGYGCEMDEHSCPVQLSWDM